MATHMSSANARAPSGTFVFYDTETTGLNVAFDQILQLAMIKTDPSFSEDDPGVETVNLRIRRARHIVPSPTAMLTTRLSGADVELGKPFRAAMREAHDLIRHWAPAVLIGYNNVRFDEEILRHNLFSALLPPFVTQTGGSTRADLMHIAHAVSVVEPGAIVVPRDAEGRPSYRLGPLARANGVLFDEAQAHDALADVRATMSLARLLRDRAPKTFAWALGLADRDHARELLLAPPGALLLRMVGGAPFVRPLVVVSGVQDDRSAYLCVDVSVDPALYLGLDAGELVALIDTPHSPIVKVRANTHPVMWPLKPGAPEVDRLLPFVRDRAVSQPATDAVGRPLDPQEIDRRVSLVLDAVEFSVAARAAAEAIRAARPPRPYVEQQLYESFPDRLDYQIADEFLRTDPAGRLKAYALLRDTRLREFAARILGDETPEELVPSERARLDAWRRDRIHGPSTSPWRTIAEAREELISLRAAHPTDLLRLDDIEAYLASIAESAPPA